LMIHQVNHSNSFFTYSLNNHLIEYNDAYSNLNKSTLV
jgi:hypothetical protein